MNDLAKVSSSVRTGLANPNLYIYLLSPPPPARIPPEAARSSHAGLAQSLLGWLRHTKPNPPISSLRSRRTSVPMLKLGGGGQDWACSVAGTGLGGEETSFEVARLGQRGKAGSGGPGWGCAGIPDSAPGAGMLQAGAGGPALEGQGVEEVGTPEGGGEERPALHPPAPALRLLNRKPQGGSGEIKTPENDLQRGRLSRGPRAAPPAAGMGDHGGQPERSAPHAPGTPAGVGAAAVNGLLHNGFHPSRLCSRGPPGGGDAAPQRLPLQPELQPQPPPPQHDSPAKKCRLRRRMDSGRKNRPRKSQGGERGRRAGRDPRERRDRHLSAPGASQPRLSGDGFEGAHGTDSFPRGARRYRSLSCFHLWNGPI